MNGIVLGEGKKEVYFIQEIFIQSSFDRYFIPFHIEDHKGSPFPIESDALSGFIENHGGSGDALLLKSEQGRPTLETVVGSFMQELVEKRAFFSAVIDLDGDEFEEVMDNIFETPRARYRDFEYETVQTFSAKPDYLRERYRVRFGDVSDTFGVIAFIESLDEAAGISKSETSESWEPKIEQYVSNTSGIVNDIINTLI